MNAVVKGKVVGTGHPCTNGHERWISLVARDDESHLSYDADVLLIPDDGSQVVVSREELAVARRSLERNTFAGSWDPDTEWGYRSGWNAAIESILGTEGGDHDKD